MSEQLPTLKRREVSGVLASCAKCVFSDVMRPDPKVLQTIRVCRRNPPTMISVAVKIDGRGNVGSMLQIQLQHCPPSPEDWCYAFVPGQRVESEVPVDASPRKREVIGTSDDP